MADTTIDTPAVASNIQASAAENAPSLESIKAKMADDAKDNTPSVDLGKILQQHGVKSADAASPSSTTDTTPKETEAEPTAEEAAPDADYETAVKAMRRDGMTPSQIKNFGTPDEVKAYGFKRLDSQSHQDAFGRKYKDAVEKLEKATGTPATTEQKIVAANKAIDSLKESLGPDVAEAFRPIVEALESQISSIKGSVEAQQMKAQEAEIKSLRTTLAKDYPQLADDAEFEAVYKKMDALDRTGEYTSIKDLMLDAAKLVLPAPTFADVQKQMADGKRARIAGQPQDSSRGRSNAAETPESKGRSLMTQLREKHKF